MTAPRKSKSLPATPVRCAIYTRKSTEEGLDQDFNSLDAQREAAEAYVHSQAHAGWTALSTHYDDGGYSGSNLDRPALQRLLADIEAGQVDCVVTHRVDRLSRSLLDFAKLMETLEQHGVAFVSVTQQLNSASSMGRLVLNVLLSFAQFERAHCRADAGQGCGGATQGQVVGRPANPGLRRGRAKQEAGGQRGRGSAGAGHLCTVPGAWELAAGGGGVGSAGLVHQADNNASGPGTGRPALHQGQPVSTVDQRHLRRPGALSQGGAFRRAAGRRRSRGLGASASAVGRERPGTAGRTAEPLAGTLA